MCGIAGILASVPPPVARRAVAGMVGALRHRGPDGEGFLERADSGVSLVLGHRRLAIIDLSADAAQPMRSADGQLQVVLNGEIYNHVELRAALETRGRTFRTRSDTEVLLEAWAEWGPAALDRVVGMFAFALYDQRKRVLTLARDQFAMKPLYYAETSGGIAFASEIPPLLELPGVGRAVHRATLDDYLATAVGAQVGRTMFADVREIPGAHLAEVAWDAPTVVRPRRYWRIPEMRASGLSLTETTRRFRELLEESVRLHLRSDVPTGLMLSGGQDSSSLLALTRHVVGPGVPLHTFSFRGGDGAFDEGPYIDSAREAAGAIGHEVTLSAEEWAAEFPTLVASQGEPFGSPVIYAQRRLFAAAAAAGIRVVLDGQGADEFLAGYSSARPKRLVSLLRRGQWIRCARVASGYAAGGASWRSLVGGTARSVLSAPGGRYALRTALAEALEAPSLRWLMRYADRNAMAYSIENRLPFLTPPLVEFVLGIPEEHFISPDGRGKQPLREAMRGLVPDFVRERRSKVGFDVPVEEWLSQTPEVARLLEDSADIPSIDGARARVLAGEVRSGARLPRGRAFEAWRLVALAAWTETFSVTYR